MNVQDNGDQDKSIAVFCGDASAALNRRPELMQRFAELRPNAWIVCPKPEKRHAEELRSMGWRVFEMEANKQSLNPFSDILYFKSILAFLREHKPADVFVFHVKPILYVGFACRFLRIRCHSLFAGLGFLFSPGGGLKKRLLQKIASMMFRSSLAKSATLFFQNPDDLATFESLRVVTSRSPTCVVNGSGISLDKFPFSEPVAGEVISFLLVGRILRDKGIPEYYEAAKKLKEEHGNGVRFGLLGPFDDNPNAMPEDVIQKWHDEGVIEYLGVTDDISPYLRDMSVFVLPSFYMEGTPKIILESLATGRAVITTNSRGCRETVVNSVNGFIVEPRDVDELTTAMSHFVTVPQDVITMGQASRKLAAQKYDVDVVNGQMLKEMGLE